MSRVLAEPDLKARARVARRIAPPHNPAWAVWCLSGTRPRPRRRGWTAPALSHAAKLAVVHVLAQVQRYRLRPLRRGVAWRGFWLTLVGHAAFPLWASLHGLRAAGT
jgi:hypothetical protein